MIRSFLSAVIVLLCFSLFESAVLSNILVLPAVPDFVLLVLLYLSIRNGKGFGEASGFVSGIFLDFLSSAPFGLNCLIRVIIGYCSGLFTKTLNSTGIFIPVLMGFVMTIAKFLLSWFISLFYPSIVIPYNPSTVSFYFELAANALFAPIVFKFLDLFSYMLIPEDSL